MDRRMLTQLKIKKYLSTTLIFISLTVSSLFGKNSLESVSKTIEGLKTQNWSILTLGVLASEDLSPEDIAALQAMQTAQPRQMRIYVTQSDFIRDVYRDFTFLAQKKQVNAVLIWPSELGNDETFQTKICQISKRMKIPIVALQDGWIEKGALLQFDNVSAQPNIEVNQKVCEIMNYIPNEVAGFSLTMH